MGLENWSLDQVDAQMDSGRQWSGDSITVSFPAFSGGMFGSDSEGELAGFRATTAAQQTALRLALQTWDDLIGTDFLFVSDSSDLELGFSSTMSGYAHAYQPQIGSVWFGASYTSGVNNLASPVPGDYGFWVYIHETGHALGLDHMGNYNGSGSWSPSSFQDSQVFSVMSYFGPLGPDRSTENAQADWTNASGVTRSAQTPMLHDVYVIQRMYGASTVTRTGDTVYGFNTSVTGSMAAILDFTRNIDPILTIFDSGGNDTLDLSGWRTNSDIRLEAGQYSSANAMTNNIVIAYGVTIENAVGGGGNDRIIGNSAANRLVGGSGDDQLIGGDGNDSLTGSSGNDTCEGGAGADTGVVAANFASCTVSYDAGRAEFRISASSTGTDLFYGVERFQFSDRLLTADQLLSGDSTAPTLLYSSPEDDATGVTTILTLRLTFSETVNAGSGEIRIFRSNGQLVEAIPVTDASRVSIDGDTVTITPGAALAQGTGFFVKVAPGALQDGAGNPYAGISGDKVLNFTTQNQSSDTIAPTLLERTPADNSTGVQADAIIVLRFSEPMVAASGNITLRSADGSLFESIPVTDAARVSINGATVTIDPNAGFAPGTTYSLNVANGAFSDASGNAFAGISGSTAYDFRTAGTAGDTTAPTLNSRSPVDGATGIAVSSVFTLSFSENMRAGSGQIEIRSADGSLVRSIPVNDAEQVRINGNVVTIDPAIDLPAGGSFFVSIPAGTLLDLSGNAFAGFTSTTAWNFSTSEGQAGEDDFPWSTGTQGLITVDGGEVQGRIENTGDLDLFRIELTAGVTYRLKVMSRGDDALPDPYLIIYDPDVVEVGKDNDSGSGFDASLTFTPDVTGTYYIGAFDTGNGTGDYAVAAVEVDLSDDFPWSTDTPGLITVDGGALQGRIEVGGDLDLFRVELTAGTTYRLDVVSSGSDGLPDPYLTLYDPDVVEVGKNNDGGRGSDASLTFTPDVTGTYYLGALETGSGTGDYSVSVVEVDAINDDYPNSTATTGVLRTDGTPLFGRIDYGDDLDLVSVFLEEGITYRINVSQSGSAPAEDPTLWLYGAELEFLDEDSNGGGGDVDASLTYTAEFTGYHYVGIDDETGSTGSYVVSAVEAGDAIDDLPYEGGVRGDLRVDGTPAGGRIDYANDYDVFTVELEAGVTYRFDMTRVVAGSLSDPLLRIYNLNGELLGEDDDSGGGYNASISFTAPTTGSYLLGAFDRSTDTGAYSLRAITVDETAPELISATPADDATGVGIDAPLVLRFSEDVQPGTGDILLFNGNGSLARAINVTDGALVQFADGVVTVDAGADLTPGADYYVLMEPGVITDLAGNAFAGMDDPEMLDFSTVELEASDDFPLDATTKGVVTVNGAAVSGAIDYANDGDLLRIDMVRGKTYVIELTRTATGGLADPYLALYAPNGEFVSFDDDSGNAGNSRIRFTALEAGTFFLGVFDYGTGTGAYTLRAISGQEDFLIGDAGPNVLRGFAGNDTLDGAGGVDTLEGGTGSDLLVVDDSRDVVRESSGGGTDTVQSTASFTLPANVERLKLVGDAPVNATGNAQPNQITGNAGANRLAGQGGADTIAGGDGADVLDGSIGGDLLRGEAGNDTMRGGDGADRLAGGAGKDQLLGGVGPDRFLFDTALSATTNVDTVSDFARGQGDLLQLDDDIFRALAGFTGGSLPAGRFQALAGVDEAQGSSVRIIYNTTTGALFYDPDGNGSQAGVQFAILTGAPALTAGDVFIVA